MPVIDVAPQVIAVTATRYVQVASMVLVVYDHILTFQKEIDYVWRGVHTRSWPRLLFLAARYTPVIALMINSPAIFQFPHSESVSRDWLWFHGWSGFFFFAGVQVISQMRLWAMYRSGKVFLSMTIIILAGLLAMGLVEGFGYSKLKTVTSSPAFGVLHICGPGSLPRYVSFFWLPPLVIETISVLLVVCKAVRHFRTGAPKEWAGSRFISAIVRYSIVYFVVVLIVYVANFYVWLRKPIYFYELFIPITFALPSIAGNRMLLSLRGIFYADNAVLPGPDNSIGLKVVNQDRGLIIEEHNPLREFESFFGENKGVR